MKEQVNPIKHPHTGKDLAMYKMEGNAVWVDEETDEVFQLIKCHTYPVRLDTGEYCWDGEWAYFIAFLGLRK